VPGSSILHARGTATLLRMEDGAWRLFVPPSKMAAHNKFVLLQAPATAASSKLADLKARMASMRAAGPKPAAKPAQPAPSPAASVIPAVRPVEASAPAPPPSNPPPIKAAEALAANASNPTQEIPQKEAKPAMPAPAVVVVEEVREEVQPGPAPAPSAKMDVAARVAARMAARAQAAKPNGATPASAAQPSVTPPAVSAEAGSREAQLAATPEGAGVPAQGAPSGTVSKPEGRSTSVPRPATHPAVLEDVDSAKGARVGGLQRERERRAGYATAPSSPRGEGEAASTCLVRWACRPQTIYAGKVNTTLESCVSSQVGYLVLVTARSRSAWIFICTVTLGCRIERLTFDSSSVRPMVVCDQQSEFTQKTLDNFSKCPPPSDTQRLCFLQTPAVVSRLPLASPAASRAAPAPPTSCWPCGARCPP
jgi:hypothetical protein